MYSCGLHSHHIGDNPNQAKYIDISIYFYIRNRRPGGALSDKKRAENDRDKFLENNIDFFGPVQLVVLSIYLSNTIS